MINDRPIQTLQNLRTRFSPEPLNSFETAERTVPIGIEIECNWRSYFSDLWVEGFPNVDADTLARISTECSEREKILLPRLMETVDLGVPKGADRYWEFAFDPVTDIGIVVEQAMILQRQGLIPLGHQHSLHITVGGINLTKDAHYMAMVLEAISSSPARILSAFHPNSQQSVGWARKGNAGMFLKEGSHDLQHGYEFATEFRILHIEKTTDLYFILNAAQLMAEMIHKCQQGEQCDDWKFIVTSCKEVLADFKLPDRNWGKPHLNSEIWRDFAFHFESIKRSILNKVLPVVYRSV